MIESCLNEKPSSAGFVLPPCRMGLESDKAGQSRTGRQRASERCVRHGYEIKTIFCEMRLPVLPSQGSTHDLTIGDLFGDWRVRALQEFWVASGDFFQTIWNVVDKWCGSDQYIILVWGK
ncbi:hypothetical protein TNIN_497581 [Trichonephila inaurata madagascariensis]|uniref:Uncharacterized protein n=1 Tax=Trichonephila inaurata madagascariensis TaxID=2747483 RepID=A0A8X6XWT7_9ARAC|nr:hypothetical protein TNIN_497581 [Trichonephila inaurata madagascariensis]